MQLKKLALTGVIAVIVLGCVIAAGCTSAPATQKNIPMDSISGVWFSNYTDENDIHAKATLLLSSIGSGVCYDVYDNGTVQKTGMTWEKTSDDVYAITYTNGESRIYRMNEAKDTLLSSSGAVIKKVSSLPEYALRILGPWCNEKTGTVTTFNADGTGLIYKPSELIGTFTWVVEDTGKFKVHYLTGGFAGRDAVWSYDEKTDILYGDDGMFSVIRPTKTTNGVTIIL